MTNPTIRPAREADRDAIIALQLASWQSAYGIVLPKDYMFEGAMEADLAAKWQGRNFTDPLVTLVADDLTGFVCTECCYEPPLIDNLHVAPQKRSGGIGAALMQETFRLLKAKGHTRVYLTVLAENTGAIAFYERLGGQRSGPIEEDLFGHPVTAYRMDFDL